MTTLIDVKVDSLGHIVTGKTPSKNIAEYFDGEFQFVTPSDLNFNHYYCRATETTVTEAAQAKHKNQFIPAGSIMFTCIGNTIGKCAIASNDCLTNQQINSVIPDDQNESKFIYYFLNHYKDVFRGIGLSGGAATPIINKTDFSKVVLKAPDKLFWPEIGNLLSTYDDLIENNRRRIQLLEESARLLYREWFVHLRFPGHEQVRITDGVPEGWVSGVVSDFFDTSSGGTPSRKVPEYYTGDIPWVKTQELNDGYIFTTSERITEEAIKKSSAKLFPAGTVLIAMYGATIGETGVLAVDAASNQACCALFPKHEELTPEFTHLFAMHSKQGLINLSQGAAQNNISQQVVRNYPFIMPSELLLKEFNEVVSNIYKQKANLEKQNASLAKARDLLLPKLMSGELTV